MFLRNHFQNGFVTHDVRKAVDLIDRRFGASDWRLIEPKVVLRTPEGPKEMVTSVAITWKGGYQLELIQPVSGYVAPFHSALPADKADAVPRFHHIAVRRDDETAMRAEIEQLGLPFVFEGSFGGVTFTYVDARPVLGHFLEFATTTPGMWDKSGWPRDKVVTA